jgi:hypothetical protein
VRWAIVAVLLVACGHRAPPPQRIEIGNVAPDAGPATLAEGCPPTFGAAGGACTTGTSCAYPEGSCYCGAPSYCGGAAPPPDYYDRPSSWQCSATPPAVRADGCPGTEPQGACGDEGKSCVYGSCCVTPYTCTGGQWVQGMGECPP